MSKKKKNKNKMMKQQETLPKNAIIVTDANVATGVIYKNKSIVHNIHFWHKFVIGNTGNLDRNTILKAILDHVHPLDLIPVQFVKDSGMNAYFLARNCGPAIEKLCKDNLFVANPQNPNNPFKISIILSFSTVNDIRIDVQKNISSVLTKRFTTATKSLALDSFHTDTELSEFCPLSQPKIMYFVLHLCKPFHPNQLIMSNNFIRILNPIDTLTGLNITSLDLRYNLLESIDDLKPLAGLKIVELWLEGNPLCDKYEDYDYIKKIKDICPDIEKLDGVTVMQNKFPAFRRNFICNQEGFDLVDQFLERFFSLYDTRSRQNLEGLYHRNAMFSITAQYHPFQISSSNAQLKCYKLYSRNILTLADYSRNIDSLFRGNTEIIKFFTKLPETEHDPYSFTVDLICYTSTCAIIVVSGIFREIADNLLDCERMLGFTRNFVLESANGEYCIVNEQLHVFNALNNHVSRAFKVPKPLRTNNLPVAHTPKQKQQVADTLKVITNLNMEWSKKCLEECNYNLKSALNLFIDLYKVDKIPPEAFNRSK